MRRRHHARDRARQLMFLRAMSPRMATHVVRWRIRRMLFMWFTVTLLVAGGVLALTTHLAHGRTLWSLLPAGLVIWSCTGFLAHALARPIGELAEAARGFGRGELDRRIDPRRMRSWEAHVLGTSFNDMAARIAALLGHQRALMATVSHELRTPLARLRVELELLRDERGDHPRIQQAEREIESMDSLVGDVLAQSRLQSGALQRQPVRLRDFVLRVVEESRMDPTKLALEADGDTMLAIDVTLLLRALCILVDNAEQHGEGLVELSIVEEAGALLFRVDDAGPGLPDSLRQQPFAAFREGAARTGLGLSLAQGIVLAHGGALEVGQRDPQGLRFELGLPLAPPPAPSFNGPWRRARPAG